MKNIRHFNPTTKAGCGASRWGCGLGYGKEKYLERATTWLRFYDQAGNLVLTGREVEAEQAFLAAERADAEAERADAEAERAKTEAEARRAADAEVERLRALLKQQGIESGTDDEPDR